MSQHDFDLTTADANTGPTVRAGMNAMAQALASCSSGATEPSTTYAFQFWADTTSGYMKQRNAANNAWLTRWQLSVGELAALAGATYTGLVNLAPGANIASAASLDLTAATGNSPRITGTTPTSAVVMNTGQQMRLVADGEWPLTYHATTNKLNTGADYTCKAGDVIFYHKDNSGVVHGEISRPTGVAAGNVVQVNQPETVTNTASTIILGTSLFHRLNGTTTVTAFNGVPGVTYKILVDTGFILTNSAGLSILQTSANITTSGSDTFYVYMRTATTCYVFGYLRATGKAITSEFSPGAAYACRAWVLFNGTGTVAIRGSGNVSSITDNGTGDYTVNFTSALSDANYAVCGSCGKGAAGAGVRQFSSNSAADPTTAACRIATGGAGGGAEDEEYVSVSFFR